MKTVFLLSHIPDPRINKRIAVAKQYSEVTVICVRRSSQNLYEPYHKDITHEILNIDLPPARQMMKRILVSQTYKKRAVALLNKYAPDVIFTGGLDSLEIAANYKRKHPKTEIIYEVADLRESYIETPSSIIGRFITNQIKRKEKSLFKYVNKLIVTSEKFYDIYYNNLIERKNCIFMPNIPNIQIFNDYKKKDKGPFTIGFIGGIRYLKQMKLLVDAAERSGCRIIFAGAGGTTKDYEEIFKYCKGKSYVQFTGKYNYATDISKLYGSVDCVYAVYDADNPNVRIALPNKLYEAVYCQLPLLVAKGTYLSEVVNNWGVGIAVSHTDCDDLVSVLNRMKSDNCLMATMSQACKNSYDKIDSTVYDLNFARCFQ
ncbi:Glycosyltransferase involved in cell wall bisynthesis [Porphyromonadaceae bacterium KH3CP3RA]|nr:Glycosyltransferase involved in cell wall bisynthesis [Porphyromonadaceae bacterium KH3CP3RA]